jgi:hypothetical protein
VRYVFAGIIRRLFLTTLLLLLWCCSSALAAFPGRDGQLAVQPVTGGGIVLERPDGTHAARICTMRSLCGTPSAPSFAPDGQGLAFRDARTGQIEIVAPDGTCVWCLHGPRLAATPGMDPTFAGRTAVIAVTRGGELSRMSLTGAKPRRVAAGGRVTAAVSSSTGGLAVVRGGWIYVRAGRSGRLRRLVRGSEPDWSPSARFLAFTRLGSVWTVRVITATHAGGRPSAALLPVAHRLAAGSHPAWSPAGNRIAFIAPGGRVNTIGSGGAARRTVGAIRARAVAWQPRPSTPMYCTGATGSVLAQSTTSVLRQKISSPAMGALASRHGCLRLLGASRRLSSGKLDDEGAGVSDAGVGGRFSALGLFEDESEDVPCDSRVELFDNATGRNLFNWFAPDREPCHPIAPVVVDSSGFAAWKVMTSALHPTALNTVSCPSAGLCVAADSDRNVLTSTDPASGHWTATALPRPDNAFETIKTLSCPTTSFCVGATDYGVFTTTDPTGGPAAWTFTPLTQPPTPQGIVQQLGPVSCASASFCAVVSNVESATSPTGAILTSTNPTGGPAAWTASFRSTQNLDGGLSCPSTSLCIATTGTTNDAITSTNPAATQAAWASEPLSVPAGGVSCQSDSLCFLVGGSGTELLASTNPTAGASAWTPVLTTVTSQLLGQPSCASASLCVAFNAAETDNGKANVYTSTNPTAPGSWTASQVTSITPTASSCPTASLCTIVDTGHALVSTDPAAGGPSYVSTPIDGPSCFLAGSACISESLYAHDDTGTHLIDTSTLGDGNTIDHLTLEGNATTLTWTHAGQRRSFTLR